LSREHTSLPVAARVRRLEERLIEVGLLTDAQLDEVLDRFLASASPMNGARLAARAWVDEHFRLRLLSDPHAAVAEMGWVDRIPEGERLRVVANTAGLHNVIVCTLCSCYPLHLLGPSPSWYKSDAYRARVVREPRTVLAEFGLRLPAETEISVWDASADARYMVLPRRPTGTDSLSETELAQLVTRNGLIGTAAV
jgi:nitrile hydratase subunit alpha